MLLNLPGWIIDRTEESHHDLLISVTPPTAPAMYEALNEWRAQARTALAQAEGRTL